MNSESDLLRHWRKSWPLLLFQARCGQSFDHWQQTDNWNSLSSAPRKCKEQSKYKKQYIVSCVLKIKYN